MQRQYGTQALSMMLKESFLGLFSYAQNLEKKLDYEFKCNSITQRAMQLSAAY